MAKFKVILEFEFEADSAEEAEEMFWEWGDYEFIEAAHEAKVTVTEAKTG
jgi:hypothetical protein